MATLRESGHCVATVQVSVCVEAGSLTGPELTDFLALADAGSVAVRAELGPHLDLPGDATRVEFYIGAGVGIPHVTFAHEPWIFMHPETIRKDMAPYLHEMVHAMAQWSWRKSEWIAEGFANHIASRAVQRTNGYHRSFVLPDGLAQMQRWHATPEAAHVLPLVGAPGRRGRYAPELAVRWRGLMSDRRRYAPAFYAYSWSLTAWLVGEIGIDGLRRIAESDDPDTTAKTHHGATVTEFKQRWLDATFGVGFRVGRLPCQRLVALNSA